MNQKTSQLESFMIIFLDGTMRLSLLTVSVFVCLVGLIISPFPALILFCCYISGCVVCWCLIIYQRKASIYLQRLVSFCRRRRLSSNILSRSSSNFCSVCDDSSCRRHGNKVCIPWKNLYIQEDLNNALEHFYDRIIENFVSSWYGILTDDDDFLRELRYCLKYASASVISRFKKLDPTRIISNKLSPIAVKHIDDYLYMQQIVKLKSTRFNDIIVEYLGKRLHVAVTNRKNELAYLKHLTSLLLPQLLPDKYLKCKNFSTIIREILAGWVFLPLMDVIADPNIINSLVILLVTYKYKSKKILSQQVSIKNVEFFSNFARSDNKPSSFATDLNHIRKSTELLYAFMQFLKKEEQVHFLNFCLDVDDFNNKLLTPELNKKQLEDLYSSACKLRKEYLTKETDSFIDCSDDIVADFNSVLEDGVYSVARLRTSKSLYLAYEHALTILETIWLPAFFHSNEFYNYICGSKVTATYNKTFKKKFECGNNIQGTVSKISTGLGKIKGALKPNQPIDGAVYPSEWMPVENGTVEDIIDSDASSATIIRDLSTWKVSITSYQASVNKTINFCINVVDSISNEEKRHWVVFRRDQDFYSLKAKLIEFHGESEICDSPLPSRRSGNTVEMRMNKYEDFLRKLLQKKSLKGSDLLYTFLTAVEDFTFLIVTSTPAIQDLGNIYQSVAQKLRKEKGQHLDSFMATFLSSSIDVSKQGKFEWAEMGDEIERDLTSKTTLLPKTYRNRIFNDNFGIDSYRNLKETSSNSFNPPGISECLFYLLKHVLKVRHGILRFYAAVYTVAHNALDSLCRLLIDYKLKAVLSQSALSYLIKLSEGVIFGSYQLPTPEELAQRKAAAFQAIGSIRHPLVAKLLGTELSGGMTMVLEILQHPHYNKHLAYNFLDSILIEMYPGLQREF